MDNFDIDLENVTLDAIEAALEGFNSEYTSFFEVALAGDVCTFSAPGDGTIASGTLREIAFYWNGYQAGLSQGDPAVGDEYE